MFGDLSAVIDNADLEGAATAHGSTSKIVTVGTVVDTPFSLTVEEYLSTDVDYLSNAIEQAARKTAEKVTDILFEQITYANYSNQHTLAASAFDGDALADIDAQADEYNLPANDKILIVSKTAGNQLKKDDSLRSTVNAGVVWAQPENGKADLLQYFDTKVKAFKFPSALVSSGVNAVLLNPDALLFALAPAPTTYNGENSYDIVDKESGIALTVSVWSKDGSRKMFGTVAVRLGYVVGNADALVRITTSDESSSS
jgi:hypothetical protein